MFQTCRNHSREQKVKWKHASVRLELKTATADLFLENADPAEKSTKRSRFCTQGKKNKKHLQAQMQTSDGLLQIWIPPFLSLLSPPSNSAKAILCFSQYTGRILSFMPTSAKTMRPTACHREQRQSWLTCASGNGHVSWPLFSFPVQRKLRQRTQTCQYRLMASCCPHSNPEPLKPWFPFKGFECHSLLHLTSLSWPPFTPLPACTLTFVFSLFLFFFCTVV